MGTSWKWLLVLFFEAVTNTALVERWCQGYSRWVILNHTACDVLSIPRLDNWRCAQAPRIAAMC